MASEVTTGGPRDIGWRLCYTAFSSSHPPENGQPLAVLPFHGFSWDVDMGFLKSLSGLFSSSGDAEAQYKRGMKKTKRNDWAGAVEDYTAVIGSVSAPHDIQAMAYFNRALAYAHLKEHAKSEEDLRAVIAMKDAPAHVAAAAQEKLARWQKRRDM